MEVQVDVEAKVMGARVTNLNDFDLEDRFDGVEYTVGSMSHLNMPIDAVYHIFGWHPAVTDANGVVHECDEAVRRHHCYKRFGWNTPQMMSKAHIFFANIKIQPITYRMIPVEVNEEGEPVATKPENQSSVPPVMQGAVAPPPRAPKRNQMMAAADAAANR